MTNHADNVSALGSVSDTVNRAMFVLIAFCIFCMLSVASPDRDLMSRDASIRLPVVDTLVSFYSFILTAPTILIAIAAYLHIFESERQRLLKLTAGEMFRSRYLFAIPTRVGSALTGATFYMLVPIAFATLTYKAMVFDVIDIVMLCVFILVCSWFSILLQLRLPGGGNKRHSVTAILASAFLILMLVIAERSYLRRPFEMTRANLENAELPYADLRDAKLSEAFLSRAFLLGAKLDRADLQGADLSHADLSGASLRGTKLAHADLTGATLEGADLSFADLFHADWSDSNLRINHTHLMNSDLRETNMRRVSFSPQFGEKGLEEASGFLKQAEEFGTNICGAIVSEGGSRRDLGCIAYDFRSRHFFELVPGKLDFN